MNRADYWPNAGHPPPNTVPLTSTYDGRKQVPQPTESAVLAGQSTKEK